MKKYIGTKTVLSDMKYIQKGFDSYRSLVIPKNAPDIQVKECRYAFYAGAAMLFEAMMMIMDDDREPTEDELNKMQAIQKELDNVLATLIEQ